MTVDHCVAALARAVEVDGRLVGHKACGVAEIRDQPRYEILTHPFFRSQNKPLATQRIKNLISFFAVTQSELCGGQVERLNGRGWFCLLFHDVVSVAVGLQN